jgi:hypothetical protein
LQTEDYARSVIRAAQPRISPDELERKVASRLERPALFVRESDRPMYWVVVHEGVLRHVVGSPEIMRTQLSRPIEAADSPDIIVQVLPYSASDHPGTDGPILIFDFADAPSSGYTECDDGGMIIEQPAATASAPDRNAGGQRSALTTSQPTAAANVATKTQVRAAVITSASCAAAITQSSHSARNRVATRFRTVPPAA